MTRSLREAFAAGLLLEAGTVLAMALLLAVGASAQSAASGSSTGLSGQAAAQAPAQQQTPEAKQDALPDAPTPATSVQTSAATGAANASREPCRVFDLRWRRTEKDAQGRRLPDPCLDPANPYQIFVSSQTVPPLTVKQKGYLAVRDFVSVGNLVTVTGVAAFTVGTNAHTAYGPGWKGFGRDAGYSLVQGATIDFFGTFAVPSLAHQDPRYFRMPDASIARRTLHAIAHTVIARGDNGRPMPNYSTLFTYPIVAEISNLYVPGVNGNAPSTGRRVILGYATNPVGDLVTEFLPDVARHVHINIIFVQRVLNQVAINSSSTP